ncbi:TPA: transcription-repair coupling factor [Candidatus Gracilibacteria bacterium]|nr:transcription-repair coupling factor [Candidatus Gracilibacteria bacterium]
MSFSKELSEGIWDFFPKIKTLSVSKKKRFFSTYGLANISAKSFFVADYLRRHAPHHLFYIVEKKSEIIEYAHLFTSFLLNEYSTCYFGFSSVEKDIQRDKFLLANKIAKKQKTIFFLSREQAMDLYPHAISLSHKKFVLNTSDSLTHSVLFKKLETAGYKHSYSQQYLEEGEFIKKGEQIIIFPLGAKNEVVINFDFEVISRIDIIDSVQNMNILSEIENIEILAVGNEEINSELLDLITAKDLLFIEEFSDLDEYFQKKLLQTPAKIIESSVFPINQVESLHLRFLSLLKFYNIPDFLNDLREKINTGWKIILVTKRFEEIKTIFEEENIPFSSHFDSISPIALVDAENAEFVPPSFQNQEEKILFLTDREVFQMKTQQKRSENNQDMNDFLSSLKAGDFVVHADHGIGKFLGIAEQEISGITREYLEVEYLKNDKLFVPIAYADKVSRYLTSEDSQPKLTRLGGKEWSKSQSKAKKETAEMAKELLELYAKREKAHAYQCDEDSEQMSQFEADFQYSPTPGQLAAIRDIKKDLEGKKPMDRLVCGDVGFGKTEVAMRAAFKAVENGLQVAVIAPITILVDQHYKNFKSRMGDFGIIIEEISRFKSVKEQKIILEKSKAGKIDILIGTHRLLSPDVKFHNLGLLIVDEEQKFGVKQKEKIKNMKKGVHILTMTATPIPRTLNLALHNLRDISTITTPPPGRLPILTEVRKFSDTLIVEVIKKELERKGQVYFLHNRVETIESMADKLRLLIPSASFVVAHGQLNSHELEDKIESFKSGKFDVLISSTIIENGIDLPNANTMIINNADRFGLSQLYQLRGRIGRSGRQAYAYLLYNQDKLPMDSKKRLRAIVEASELGSGFQLSMRDLEIRGAGDVLGISQSGTVNSIGVNHFLKLLNKEIKILEKQSKFDATDKGKKIKLEEVVEDVQIEIPLNAFVPSFFIPSTKEKILIYQRFASIEGIETLHELSEELSEEYGRLPVEVRNLVKILEIKILAKKALVKAVKFQGDNVELHLAKSVTAKEIMQLLEEQPNWTISGSSLVLPQKQLGLDFVGVIEKALELLVKKTSSE